ncbi:rabankyrin-5 isoform X2 [Atheta coriaria]
MQDTEDTFAARLLKTVATVHDTATFSDITITLGQGKVTHAHKLVLCARSELFDEAALQQSQLDWSEVDADVGTILIRWLYTDEIGFSDDEITLKLIRKAHEFHLNGLVSACEQKLIASVEVRTCVKFYSVAEEIEAEELRAYCSALISAHWDDLDRGDFEHMSGPLLYKMLKSKTQLPLHAAVRLQREDVVFLCLVENASRLSDIVNVWSPSGELPLDLALRAKNESITKTLVQHNADINIRDHAGETLLHRAVRQEDAFSALFLLDANCDATTTTRNENETALHLLANAQNLDDQLTIAEKLLNKNVNINAQNKHGFTALHITIMADNKGIFDLLLSNEHLDANLKTNEDHTPLYYALLKYESGEDSYALCLLKQKVQTDPLYTKNNDSLLQILLQDGATNAATFLVDHVHNYNHCNTLGETCLHTACKKNAHEFIAKMLSLGANPNILTTSERRAALHYCILGDALDAIDAVVLYNQQDGASAAGVKADFNIRDADGETPISLALSMGRKRLVAVLISGGADVNVRNGKDFTLLHQAIMKEDPETALFLLEHGADINAMTSDYESPLQLAIHCRLGEVVDALCSKGVDMSATDRLGNCPLWAALDSGQDNIASILVRHGADTDCWGNGPEGCQQTLLHRAIDENKEAVAIFLVQAGCDLDSPRMPGPKGEGGDEAKDKASSLHLCCQWGLDRVVQTLVEHRANVNARDCENKTPLHLAIENQHPAIISLLLSVPEIDLSLRDKSGLSPFATALTVRNNKAAQSILDKMPSAAEQFDAKGHNFLHTAIKKADLESVLFLLSIQVDVNSRVQDPTLTPPIHLAARCGNETLLRSLILAGARIEDRDVHKQTALHVAATAGNAPGVLALLQNNADFDAVDMNGDNALHVAVREGHLNVVRVLLTESTIDAEAVNLKGRNPLHELCKHGKDNSAAICELFLECMSDYPINKADVDGNTPLLHAYMKGNGNLCRVLVKASASLAMENHERVTIFNYQVATKQLLYRLLDQLSQQVPWASTDMCQECGVSFTIMIRKHHCRHCSRVLCSKCSDQEVPIIKFGENKPVRVCKVCFDVLKSGVGP